MKWFLRLLEKARPLYEKGGKLSFLYPLHEATEGFVFTQSTVTKNAPHLRDPLDIKRTMMTVIIALIPCTLFGIYNAGYQYDVVNQIPNANFWTHWINGAILVMPIVMTSYIVGGLWEVLFALIRKHEINEGFLVTGLLFPLTLPPDIPLWQVALGISFGVVIGKEIFGGTGFNVLNPALTARCFLYFAYPAQISGDRVWTAVTDPSKTIEGFTGATPLAVLQSAPDQSNVVELLHQAGYTLKNMTDGFIPGSIGETSFIAIAIGALILIATGVGSWRIMAGCFLGMAGTGILVNFLPGQDVNPAMRLPFYYHMVIGGAAFGNVFMATDPVSATATNVGKWIFGVMVGFITVVIRLFNPAYMEGSMLAILFGNVMAPMIDYFVLQTHINKRSRYLRKMAYAER